MQFPQVRSSFHENWTAFFPQKSVNNHSLFSFLKSRQFWRSKHFKIKSQCKSRARWKCQVLTRWFCSSSFSVFSQENDAFPASKHILHVLRTLRKEHYSQAEIDQLFISVVLPNFSYALSVYGASESDLTVIQNFLDRCHKRRFISFPVFIKNLSNKQDRNILKKLISTDCHPLKDIIPVHKTYVHNLRKKGCAHPKINKQRFMITFVNRLIFKLHLL